MGASRHATVSGSESPARVLGCPHCAKPLRAREVDGVEVDVCPSCHGLWLDHGEFDRIVQWHRDEVPNGSKASTTESPRRQRSVAERTLDGATSEIGELAVRGAAEGARLVAKSVVDTAHTGFRLVAGDANTIVQITSETAQTLAGAGDAIGEFVGHIVEAAPEVLGGLLEGL